MKMRNFFGLFNNQQYNVMFVSDFHGFDTASPPDIGGKFQGIHGKYFYIKTTCLCTAVVFTYS